MSAADELIEDEVLIPGRPPRRLRLAVPIEFNKTTYDSVVLREPDATALLKARAESDPLSQALTLIREVSGLPQQVVVKLPQQALEAAAKYFEGFSPPSPETGQT